MAIRAKFFSFRAITTKSGTILQIDGEVIGKVKKINAEILPKALTVIVPAKD